MSSSPSANGDASGAVRRASGRVRQQPTYTSSPFSNGKRKRSDEENDVQMPDDYVSDEDVPSGDEEPDEEEVREQNRKFRKAKGAAPKKQAAKKPKVNGTTLAIRTANDGAKKQRAPKKTKAANRADAESAGGLYAQVFAGDENLEAVAARWLESFLEHESQALAELVNFVLQCAGCNTHVSEHDIEDPDGCSNRLTDIQEEYQATAPTDYPLIAKGKAGTAFKNTMSSFLKLVLKSMAANGVFYSSVLPIENIETWFTTMSSAANRSFRHTATIASLSVVSAMCEIAAERANEAANSLRQAETEGRKSKVNRARVTQLQQKARESTQAQDFIDAQLKDWFDTVFIHRYRDVDFTIRRDCATALGDWIMTLPSVFFDGEHLRYLGWVLSDTVSATRGEVVKQLMRLYKEKDKVGGLKTFTERFRGRLVEIATADAESSVRASGIELLDVLRENGLLEPDDVDAVGRLLYDSDPRVRKAVAGFFAENVNDLYNSKIDDLGGLEVLEDALPEIGEDNLETPRLEWLKFKSLAEMLIAYDSDESLPSQVERNRGDGSFALHAASTESRFTLAADILFGKVDDIEDWESLTGYLLFDHSAGRANSVADDALSQLKHECILTEQEETVLLEVVSAGVRRTITEANEKKTSTKSKLTKKQKEELSEEQEEAAHNLANTIPKLLKKFGDAPSTAAAVLRMESVLNLPSLQDVRQDSVTYGALLDDIRKQFMSHGTDDVLGPASEAILHAKSYGDLEDLTEEKLAGLWEDVINNLSELLNPDTITLRGASYTEALVALSNNLLRILRLSQVSNCIPALEDSSVATTNAASGVDYQGAIDYVIALVQRALPSNGPAPDPEDSALEDAIAARAAEAALRYLQWKLTDIYKTASTGTSADMPHEELEALAMRRDQYVTNLDAVLQSRKPGDSICITLTEYMLDLHYSSVVLKNIKLRPGVSHDWDVLIMDLHESYLKAIMKVFSAAEKNFARLTNKKLEDAPPADEADIDAEPMDEDPLSDSESEDEDDEPTQTQASQQRRERKQHNTIIAEKELCELTRSLIYAVHAGVVSEKSTRTRLERNKTKLGPNYKEILAYLDIGKTKKNAASKSRPTTKPKANGVVSKTKAKPKSNAIVAEDEVDDEIEDVDADDEDALRRRELVVENGDGAEHDEDAEAAAEAESVLGD